MSDAFAHLPFLSGTTGALTDGYFLIAADSEDHFMEYIWRLRQWGLGGTLDLIETVLGVDQPPYDATPVGTSTIRNGSDTSGPVAEFADEDDVRCAWRKTHLLVPGVVIDEGTGEESPATDIFWGPVGYYDEAFPELGGALDSKLLLEKKPNGDQSFFLTTEPDLPGFRESAAFMTFDPDVQNITVTLYETDDANWRFEGELIMGPGDDYFPWNINGDDTYDTSTGAQLEDPARLDSNGYPLIFFCQQA